MQQKPTYIFLIIFFLVISSCKNEKILLNAKLEIEEIPKLSYLTLEFKGGDTLYYNNDHFYLLCMNAVNDSTEHINKKKIKTIFENAKYIDNVFIENSRGNYRKINNFYGLKTFLKTDGRIHCSHLKKIALKKNKEYVDKLLIDPNILKTQEEDNRVRLHFLYKDSLKSSHITSNWISLNRQ